MPNLLYVRGNGVAGFEGPVILTKGNCHTFGLLTWGVIKYQVAIGPDDQLHLVYLSTDPFTGPYTDIYYSSLDLTLDLPLSELWLPMLEAPIYTSFASTVVGERTFRGPRRGRDSPGARPMDGLDGQSRPEME